MSLSRTIVWPEEFCHWKIPMTPSGIALATFRFVAQCLNQMRHHVICSTGRYSLGAVRYEKLRVAYRSGWSDGKVVYLPRGMFRFRSLLGYRLPSSKDYFGFVQFLHGNTLYLIGSQELTSIYVLSISPYRNYQPIDFICIYFIMRKVS